MNPYPESNVEDSPLAELENLRRENALLKQTLSTMTDAASGPEGKNMNWVYALEWNRDGFWAYNILTSELTLSTGWKELLGYADYEIGSDLDDWKSRVHPEDLDAVLDAFREHLGGATSHYESEHRILCKDGSYKWVLDRGSIVSWTDSGEPMRMAGTYTDIDVRKKIELEKQRLLDQLSESEQDHRQSEEMMRFIVKHDPSAIAVFDTDMRYIAASDRFLKDYEVDFSDIVGRQHYDVFPELPERWREVHQRALQGAIEKNEDDFFERPDGSICYTSWECRPWYRADGSIGGMIAYTEVITQRKLAEKALRESEEAYRTLFEASPLGMIVYKLKEQEMLKVNPAACRMYGYPREEMLTLKHEQYTSLECLRKCDFCQLIESAMDGREHECAGSGLRKDGSTFPIEAQAIPILYKGADCVLLIIKDISEQLKREEKERETHEQLEQTQRLESLGVLAGGIAHDFNNLLMAILGHADLALNDDAEGGKIEKNIGAIRDSAKSASDLCSQLLAYSGKGKLQEKRFSMSQLVEEMLHMIKTCISKKCVLNVHLDKALLQIEGDVSQVRQIIMNFVINASDAIGDRSGVIGVSTGAVEYSPKKADSGFVLKPAAPGYFVTLEVTDNGSGMDKETIKRIFEPFFTTKFTGRGLGLSAVLGIIRAHGGGLKVTSKSGEGTTFKVLLPAAAVSKERGDFGVDAPKPLHDWQQRYTVLLADDEEAVRTVCTMQLERLGLNVIPAVDGYNALGVYKKRADEIDLVILDLTMPRMDGEETFRELKQLDAEVQVVLSSGYSEVDIAKRFAGKDVAGFLRKPFTLAELNAVLMDVLA